MAQPLMNFYRYTTSTGGGPLVVRTGPGALGVVTINQIGSTASLVTIIDGTSTGSGTQIANLTPSALGSFAYGVTLANGLTLCSSSSSTAEITVTWS